MIAVPALVAAGTFFTLIATSTLIFLPPALAPVPVSTAEAAALLKCQEVGPGLAVVVDGVPVWTGADFDELSADQLAVWTGGQEEVANVHMVCAPDLAQMGVQAGLGLYFLTHASGIQYVNEGLKEIHALQRQYREDHGEWATSLELLGVSPGHPAVTLHLDVREDGVGWTARGTHTLSLWSCEVYSMERWGMGSPERPMCTPLKPDHPAYPDFPRIAAEAGERGGDAGPPGPG